MLNKYFVNAKEYASYESSGMHQSSDGLFSGECVHTDDAYRYAVEHMKDSDVEDFLKWCYFDSENCNLTPEHFLANEYMVVDFFFDCSPDWSKVDEDELNLYEREEPKWSW